MNSNTRRLLVTFGLGLGLALGLLWGLGGAPPTAHAGAGDVYCVTLAGGGPYAACDQVFTNVQDAVDAADGGEEIRVASGIYTGVSTRTAPLWYSGPSSVITQVVYISKTITVRGGYTTTNGFTAPPDPVNNPTTLDAEGNGRVLVIFGDYTPSLNPTISVIVEGLHITGGNAAGLGGDPGRDAAGGVGVYFATITIHNCWVSDNVAEVAGGIGLAYSGAILSENIIEANTAITRANCGIYCGEGGGIGLAISTATLIGNTIISNTAGYDGGGIITTGRIDEDTIIGSTIVLTGNTIISNTSLYAGGGGLYMDTTTATLSGNSFIANQARDVSGVQGGGAVYLWDSKATFVGAAIISNTTTSLGGGVFLSGEDGSDATLINSVIADNRAEIKGSGLYLERLSSYRLLHVTIAHNTGGDESGIHVTTDEYNQYSTVIMTNTILVGHAVGITVTEGCTATLESTLWSNIPDWGGDGDITTNNDYTGDPAFVDPAAWDYHLTGKSAAIDKGIDTLVLVDKDGVVRPQLRAPDLGAYEYVPPPVGGHTEPLRPLAISWLWLLLAGVATVAIAATLKRRLA